MHYSQRNTMSLVEQQKKYIINNIDRLSREDIINVIRIHIIQTGLSSYIRETKNGIMINLDDINDFGIIRKMYEQTNHLCLKLDRTL